MEFIWSVMSLKASSTVILNAVIKHHKCKKANEGVTQGCLDFSSYFKYNAQRRITVKNPQLKYAYIRGILLHCIYFNCTLY